MSSTTNNFRQILKTSSIIGSTSLLTIVFGLIRTKVLAVLLGPAGVGIAGLLSGIMGTASTLSGMGISMSGVRQVAEATGRGDESHTALVQRALWLATLLLGGSGSLLLWLFRKPIAVQICGSSDMSNSVGWLACGVFFSVVGGSQGAILQGLRRVTELAASGIAGTLVGTILAIVCVSIWGEYGIVPYLVIVPICSFITAAYFLRRIPKPASASKVAWMQVRSELPPLMRMGAFLMLSSLMTSGTQLLIRVFVSNEFGVAATGVFQAAWSVSMTYIGIVLSSMATDYYPRLTAAIHDRVQARQLVNEQTYIALLLAGPVLVGMIGLAPFVIELLYAKGFSEAVSILRWQIVGDFFKIIAWPLGFVMLASGAGRMFMIAETSWNLLYIILVTYGAKSAGFSILGISFLLSYLLILGINYLMAKRLLDFRFSRDNILLMVMLLIAICLSVAANVFITSSVVVVVCITVVVLMYSLRRLSDVANLRGPVASIISRCTRFLR